MNHSARRLASSSVALALALCACSSGSGGGASDSGTSSADGRDDSSVDSGVSPGDGGGATDTGAIADTGASTGLLLDGGENGGLPFKPGDSIVFDDSAEDASTLNKVQIFDYTGACALAQAGNPKASSAYLDLVSATGAPFAVGTLSLGAHLTISLVQRDATCQVSSVLATSGSFTITALDATSLRGSFTAMLPGVGTVSGNVNATACTAAQAPTGTCQP